jgi:hypothetical protein
MSRRTPLSWVRAAWATCDRCGGDLPVIDGDNAHVDLPRSRRSGDCVGHTTRLGRCGAYADCDLIRFARAADDEAPR